jgi:hypothetical protein
MRSPHASHRVSRGSGRAIRAFPAIRERSPQVDIRFPTSGRRAGEHRSPMAITAGATRASPAPPRPRPGPPLRLFEPSPGPTASRGASAGRHDRHALDDELQRRRKAQHPHRRALRVLDKLGFPCTVARKRNMMHVTLHLDSTAHPDGSQAA